MSPVDLPARYQPNPAPPSRAAAPLAAAAVLVAALAIALPGLALPALVAVVLAAVTSSGRVRTVVLALGGLLATVALLRFTIEFAVPRIVIAGQHAAEEKAVSRLREILWAQERVREQRWIDTDADGTPEFALLGELTGEGTPRPGARAALPLLRSAHFHRQDAPAPAGRVYLGEGYHYVVYLPTRAAARDATRGGAGEHEPSAAQIDPARAAARFVAYAWPAAIDRGGRRAFFIDQDETICQSDNRATSYTGTSAIPMPDAAFDGPALDGRPCGPGASDHGTWAPWRKKKGLQMNR